MPAVGPLIMAGGAIGGSLLGRKAASGTTQPSAMELAAQQGQTAAAGQAMGQSRTLFGMGVPQLQQAGRYFSTLAGGNRAATGQMLAPDIENINSVYGGTARNLSRFLRGPTRDVQLAETERERAGQIGSLFRNARPAAASELGRLGGGETGAALSGTGQAGSIFGTMAGQGLQSRFGGAQLQEQAGADFGGLIFNLLKLYANRGQQSAGA